MQPTRRHLLLGVGASALAACTADKQPTSATPTLDDTLRSEAVSREHALIDAYLAALRDHPDLTPRLAPLLGEHAAHLAALEPVPPSPTPTAPAPVPASGVRPRQAVLRDLAVQEKRAAAAHAEAAERAESSSGCDRVLAPLLASLAASEASHAVVL